MINNDIIYQQEVQAQVHNKSIEGVIKENKNSKGKVCRYNYKNKLINT